MVYVKICTTLTIYKKLYGYQYLSASNPHISEKFSVTPQISLTAHSAHLEIQKHFSITQRIYIPIQFRASTSPLSLFSAHFSPDLSGSIRARSRAAGTHSEQRKEEKTRGKEDKSAALSLSRSLSMSLLLSVCSSLLTGSFFSQKIRPARNLPREAESSNLRAPGLARSERERGEIPGGPRESDARVRGRLRALP